MVRLLLALVTIMAVLAGCQVTEQPDSSDGLSELLTYPESREPIGPPAMYIAFGIEGSLLTIGETSREYMLTVTNEATQDSRVFVPRLQARYGGTNDNNPELEMVRAKLIPELSEISNAGLSRDASAKYRLSLPLDDDNRFFTGALEVHISPPGSHVAPMRWHEYVWIE